MRKILNHHKLDTALNYMAQYYNKIIKANYKTGVYSVLQVDDSEMKYATEPTDIFTWIKEVGERLIGDYDKESYYAFMSYEHISNLHHPSTCYYRKLVGNDYHDVFIELVPLGNEEIYIFVKDFDLIESGE